MLEQHKELRLGVKTDELNVPNLAEVSDGFAGETPGEGWIDQFSKYQKDE